MASEEDLAMLVLMVGNEMLTEEEMGMVIDAQDGDLTLSASQVWEIRAGKYHALVNISESGSSRNMGDLHKNALKMAEYYRGKTADAVIDVTETVGATRIGRIVRE